PATMTAPESGTKPAHTRMKSPAAVSTRPPRRSSPAKERSKWRLSGSSLGGAPPDGSCLGLRFFKKSGDGSFYTGSCAARCGRTRSRFIGAAGGRGFARRLTCEGSERGLGDADSGRDVLASENGGGGVGGEASPEDLPCCPARPCLASRTFPS